MKQPWHSVLWDIWTSQGLSAFMWFCAGAVSMLLVTLMIGMYYVPQ